MCICNVVRTSLASLEFQPLELTSCRFIIPCAHAQHAGVMQLGLSVLGRQISNFAKKKATYHHMHFRPFQCLLHLFKSVWNTATVASLLPASSFGLGLASTSLRRSQLMPDHMYSGKSPQLSKIYSSVRLWPSCQFKAVELDGKILVS